MTDNDIIKALECCSEKNCKQCPCFDENIECGENLIKHALDLINRQKAEIERLQDSNRRLRDDMRMMLNNDNGCEQIRAEAIKEFAERLKTKGDRYAWVVGISKDEINHLVKEMTEQSTGYGSSKMTEGNG